MTREELLQQYAAGGRDFRGMDLTGFEMASTRILRDGEPVAEFTDASLARMALVMFQSNEAANGNTAHAWTLEGE